MGVRGWLQGLVLSTAALLYSGCSIDDSSPASPPPPPPPATGQVDYQFHKMSSGNKEMPDKAQNTKLADITTEVTEADTQMLTGYEVPTDVDTGVAVPSLVMATSDLRVEEDPSTLEGVVVADDNQVLFTYLTNFGQLRSTTNLGFLQSFEHRRLRMWGENMDIEWVQEVGPGLDFFLVGILYEDVMIPGDSKNYRLKGAPNYSVELTANDPVAGNGTVVLNGDTRTLVYGNFYTHTDGRRFRLMDGGNNDTVVQVGVRTFELADVDVTDDVFSQDTIWLDSLAIPRVGCKIKAVKNASNEWDVQSIEVQMRANGRVQIPPGQTLRSVVDNYQAMLSRKWDLTNEGENADGKQEVWVRKDPELDLQQ
jgi:hypothetical protein